MAAMNRSSEHSAPGVQLRALTKAFGDVQAVRGLDLSISPGETVALLGPNGAGKSTTIDLLLGLQLPDAGTVTLFGDTPDAAVKAGRVSAMLQTGQLIREISVRELIAMMASLFETALEVDEVLELTGLTELADRRTDKLSGGETQRVRFALAIVPDPALLVLDEPTVALDVEARKEFWTTMRRFAERGATIVFATHHLEEADAYADRIVLLAQGSVVADGSATQIKARVRMRTIRSTLPSVAASELAALPGVTTAERHGDSALLACSDADAALRALIAAYPEATDFEVRGAGLEEAFLSLTSAGRPGADPRPPTLSNDSEVVR
jgi:ABC-2 type transport system ATP-binding protein